MRRSWSSDHRVANAPVGIAFSPPSSTVCYTISYDPLARVTSTIVSELIKIYIYIYIYIHTYAHWDDFFLACSAYNRPFVPTRSGKFMRAFPIHHPCQPFFRPLTHPLFVSGKLIRDAASQRKNALSPLTYTPSKNFNNL